MIIYVQEEENNKFQKLQKRIINICKHKKIYNETKISINDLTKYIPNEKEFALFIYDLLENKNQILSIFPDFNSYQGENALTKFYSYYDKNKILFDNKENINQIFNYGYNDTENAYNKMNRKILINLAFIGNKDSGKSTTIGQLLYNTGNIIQNLFIETNNTVNDLGIKSYKFSWLLDRIWDERAYKWTIIPHIKKFETENYDFNLIDLPDSFKLKNNMVKGLSLTEAAVITVEADNDILENIYIKNYLIIAFTIYS